MRTKPTIFLAAIMLLILTLTGCRTTRQTETPVAFTRTQQNKMLTPLAQYPTDVQFISAKTSITFDYNGLSATVKGRLRMRRNEVVQVSITPLGLMEVAVVEFTPKGAYIIDRVNKRYALLDYSSGRMNLIGINFNTVQSLFWNRLFIPGEKEAWRHTSDFAISDDGTQRRIEPKRQRMLKCQFYTDADCKQLQQSNLSLQQYAVTWRYDEPELLDTYAYPTIHDVSISGSSRAIGAHIALNGISTFDTGWQGGTDLSRYKEVDLEQVMSILNMLR